MVQQKFSKMKKNQDYKKIKRGLAKAMAVSFLSGMGLMLISPLSNIATIFLWLDIALVFAWQVFDEKDEKQEREQSYKNK